MTYTLSCSNSIHRICIILLLVLCSNRLFSHQLESHSISFTKLLDSIQIELSNENSVLNKTPIILLRKATYFTNKKEYSNAFNYYQQVLANKTINELTKAATFLQIAKLGLLLPGTYNSDTYYLKADSILNNQLNKEEKRFYYNYILKQINEEKAQFLPNKIVNDALEYCKKHEFWKTYIQYQYGLLFYHRNTGELLRAQYYYNDVLNTLEHHPWPEMQNQVLFFAMDVYQNIQDSGRIQRDLNLAIKLSKELNKPYLLARGLNDMGNLYINQKKHRLAISKFKEAAEINKLNNNLNRLGINYLNIADAFRYLNQYDSASIYYKKSIVYNNKTNFSIGNSFCYNGLLNICIEECKLSDAKRIAKQAKVALTISDYPEIKSQLYRTFAKYYDFLEIKDSTILYLKKSLNYGDSINNIEIHKQMQAYESELKEHKISLLQVKQKLLISKQKRDKERLILLVIIIAITCSLLLVAIFMYKRKEKDNANLVKINMDLIKAQEQDKGTSDKIPDAADIALAEEFIEALISNKLFLNPDISIDFFANSLNTNRTYLSKAINSTMNKNFTQLINEFRIKESCKLLVDKQYNHLSIEGIATTVGFNSKASFNRAFKTQTKLTPSDFRKNQKIDS